MKGLHYFLALFLVSWLAALASPIPLKASELDSLKKVVKTLPENEKAGVYNRLFVLSGSYQLPDSTLFFAEQALYFAEKTQDTFQLAFANRNIGFYYNTINDYEKSISHYRSALDLLQKSRDLRRIFVIYNELSDILIGSRAYKDASELLYDGLRYSEKHAYPEGEIGIKRNLGSLNRQLGNFDKARQYIEEALQLLEEQEKIDPRDHSTLYRTLGLIYYDMGQLDEALEKFQKSLKIQKNINDHRMQMMINNSMALVYSAQKKHQLAFEHYQEALTQARAAKNNNLITAALLNIGRELTLLGDLDKANEYLNKGLSLAEKYGFTKWQRNAHNYLHTLNVEQGNYKKALEHVYDYYALEDSLKIEENRLKLAELETKYESEKKEKQIELLNKENEIKTLKLRQNRNLLVVTLLLLVVLLLSAISWRRNNMHKQKSQELLKKKEMEKQLLSTVIHTEDKERKRFATDLHDGLGPLLSSVKLYLSGLEEAPASSKPEMIHTACELIDQSIQTTRHISNNILPVELAENGLIASIRSFSNKIQYSQKLHVEINDRSEGLPFERSTEIILYRVIQELINNTIKHAGASAIWIDFIKVKELFRVDFRDDGIGFDPHSLENNEKKGMGLVNMKERIQSLGGEIKFIANEPQGTRVIITIKPDSALHT